jgi:hypothetical protein
MAEALCAEPAVSAFARQSPPAEITICSRAADLYVGHPQIRGIMYRYMDGMTSVFDRTIELTGEGMNCKELMRSYAAQLNAHEQPERPHIHLTTMDRIRIGRFGLKPLEGPVAVMVLPEHFAESAVWDLTAAEIEERLGASVIFLSLQKYAGLEHGRNLTGRLMPREMAAILSRAGAWLGFDAEAAALGWAAGTEGILFVPDSCESPDPAIRVRVPNCPRETVLELVNEIFEKDATREYGT